MLGNNTIVNCSQGENRCQITKRIVDGGENVTLFKRMCVKSEACNDNRDECSDPDKDGVVICDTCCKEDFCNKGKGPTLTNVTVEMTQSPWTTPTARAVGGTPDSSGTARIWMMWPPLYLPGSLFAGFLK